MDNAKLVMASMLIDRANKDLEKAGGDSDSFLFNKTDFKVTSWKLCRLNGVNYGW